MDVRDLRYLLAVADGGTLTRAAETLHVSRQAVAKALRSLEAEAGACLFERHGGAFVPTERGAAFVGEARPVVEAFDRLCADNLRYPGGAPAGGGRAVREALSVALVTGGRMVLPRGLIEGYSAANPWVSLNVEEMSTDAVLGSVAQGNYEIGIVGSHPELIEGFEFVCVERMGIWLCVPAGHRLAGRDALALGDLDGLPLVTAGQHNHVHRFVMRRCEQAGVVPDVRATTTDTSLLGYLAHEHAAAWFGFPPSVARPPEGAVVLPVEVDGGRDFGTYFIRRPPAGGRGGVSGAGGTGGAPAVSRAARKLWDAACAGAEKTG